MSCAPPPSASTDGRDRRDRRRRCRLPAHGRRSRLPRTRVAAARLRRQPRAHQRARHRLGGLRDRYGGGCGRRHHHAGGHAAGLRSGDHHASRHCASNRLPRRATAASTSASGLAWCPRTSRTLEPLAAAGVPGFKCFLADSGNPNFGHLTPSQFRVGDGADRRARLGDAGARRESPRHRTAARGPAAIVTTSFLESRPDAAEEDAVALVSTPRAATGARAHVVHVSSARCCALLADAKRSGLPVTAETCPHYLTFAAETIPDGATEFAACPPIRGAANRELLWAGLAGRHAGHDGVGPFAVRCRTQGRRRLRSGLRRDQFVASRATGGVDASGAAGFRFGRAQPVDVRAAGRRWPV